MGGSLLSVFYMRALSKPAGRGMEREEEEQV